MRAETRAVAYGRFTALSGGVKKGVAAVADTTTVYYV